MPSLVSPPAPAAPVPGTSAPTAPAFDEVNFTLLDRPARAPAGVSLLTAVRMAGHPELLGCGCRLGNCGECRIALRYPGETSLRRELACVVEVVSGIVICELPFPWTRAFARDNRG